MIKLPLVVFITTFVMVSCGPGSVQNTGSIRQDSGRNGQVSGLSDSAVSIHRRTIQVFRYWKFTGRIGNNPVVVDLIQKDSVLSGTYYYTRIRKPLTLDGRMDADGRFRLSETNGAYAETGVLTGSISAHDVVSGKWTDPGTGKSLDFSWSAASGEIASIALEHHRRENCERMESAFDPDRCPAIDLELMQVVALSPEATRKINDAIVASACSLSPSDEPVSTIADLLGTVQSADGETGYDCMISCRPSTNAYGIFSATIVQSIYYFGAAHPQYLIRFENFNLRTGENIELDDLLKTGYESELNLVASKLFFEENGPEGWHFENDSFELNANFSLRSDGLLFLFNPYEVGPYSAGAPEVLIPYASVRHLLKPGVVPEEWTR